MTKGKRHDMTKGKRRPYLNKTDKIKTERKELWLSFIFFNDTSCLPVNSKSYTRDNNPFMQLKSDHEQICPGMNANEIQIPYDGHRLASLVKSQQKSQNSVRYEVI